MAVTFNYNFWNNLETPDFVLCNVNKQPVGTLTCSNRKMNYSNEISEISFTVYRMVNGSINPYYDSITELQYIYLKDIGYFQITSNMVKITDKDMEYKEVTAQSTEIEFAQKYLTLFTINMGTAESIDGVSLYNNANPSFSLLDLVLEKMPSWNVGYVDPKFSGMQRSFQIDSQDIYSFLTSDVAEAFGCTFIFKTIDNTINVYDNETISRNTNIIISFQNLLKEVSVEPDIKSIKTALTLVGEDDLTVRELNMGYDTIYNFDYFHTVEYMGQDLYDAYGRYKEKYQRCVAQYTPLITRYQDLLKQIAYKTGEMLPESADSKDWTKYCLNELNIKKKSNEDKLSVLMQQGYGDKEKHPDEYSSLYAPQYEEIERIKNAINIRTNEIAALQNQKEQLNQQMQALITDIDIENNFTKEQWHILSKFIREDVLNDSNYVVTDAMTKEEALAMQQAFLDFGNAQLAKYSQPQFSFQVSMANIFALPEFREHIDQFDLFNYITILVRDDYYMKAKLLSFDIDFEENSLSVNFGSLNKTKNSNIFSLAANAMSTAASASTSVSFNKFHWDTAKSQSDTIAKNISDGLFKAGASLETTRSTMLLDDRGVFMKNTSESAHPNDQMALTGSNILFSDDDWKTTRTALGRVEYFDIEGNKKDYYGIIAELVAAGYITGCTIYGNDIKGSTITGSTITGSAISNGNGTFSVDRDGNLTANRGNIAGWNLTPTDLYDDNNVNSAGIGKYNSSYAFWAGTSFDNRNSAPFRVKHDGTVVCEKIEAKGGSIGNWVITGNGSITNGYDFTNDLSDLINATSTGMGTFGKGNWAFWAGNGRFSVNNEGFLYAQNANIQGTITATKGEIGGATITNGSIYTDGWGIYKNGSASFSNVTITGVQPGSVFGGISLDNSGNLGISQISTGFSFVPESQALTDFNLICCETVKANKAEIGYIDADYIETNVLNAGFIKADDISTELERAEHIAVKKLAANTVTTGNLGDSEGTIYGVKWKYSNNIGWYLGASSE